MTKKEEKQKMRKVNMKIFPTYRKLACDYLFFYTIDFLFLTQVKGISAADVVLKYSFYSLFSIFVQIPCNMIVEFLGKKNSLILANVLNCIYLVIIMLSRSLIDLIFAEFISSVAFAIKNIVEPSLLNESIPPSKYKGKIYSKIHAKGTSGYYLLNSISKIIAGYLFTINSYLPVICSLGVSVIVVILSLCFIEPIKRNKKNINEIFNKNELKNLKEGFVYIFKSERLKALILVSSMIAALLTVLSSYTVSLFEDLNFSSVIIGIIAAIISLVSAYASKLQEIFHKKFRNKSLITIAMMLSISCIIYGVCGLKAEEYKVLLMFIFIATIMYGFGEGMFSTLIDKYLRNFANEQIDTKIFSAKHLFRNVTKVIMGFLASFLLDKMKTAYCMIIVGTIFIILYLLIGKYMKKRVGLNPEQYSKEETKYDELKDGFEKEK